MLICAFAIPARAHPHIFIDTAFDLIFDEAGRLAAVRVEWSYDDFYSLLMVEEKKLDGDGDGVPEQSRLDAFAGQDVDWAAGFPGDFSVTIDGSEAPLAPPKDHTATWRDDRFVTSHLRPIVDPVDSTGRNIVARSYDPTYFVAYDVPGSPGTVGREGCHLQRQASDRKAAQEEYGDALAAVDMAEDPFEVVEVPDIGILFADAFVLSCDEPS